jgi:hypothetical protein
MSKFVVSFTKAVNPKTKKLSVRKIRDILSKWFAFKAKTPKI